MHLTLERDRCWNEDLIVGLAESNGSLVLGFCGLTTWTLESVLGPMFCVKYMTALLYFSIKDDVI